MTPTSPEQGPQCGEVFWNSSGFKYSFPMSTQGHLFVRQCIWFWITKYKTIGLSYLLHVTQRSKGPGSISKDLESVLSPSPPCGAQHPHSLRLQEGIPFCIGHAGSPIPSPVAGIGGCSVNIYSIHRHRHSVDMQGSTYTDPPCPGHLCCPGS